MAGGLLLLGGRLADLAGRRRMFMIGIAVFAVASAASGAAVDQGMLVASRFAQGTLGPVVSGLILESLSWRWIFFINIPVAIFVLVAVRRLVDESRADAVAISGPRRRPDVAGAVLATAGLSAVVFGLLSAGTHPWGSVTVIGALALGTALVAAFVGRERSAANPLVPLTFFANRTRATANVVTLFFTTVFFSLFFLLTLYWEQAQHYSALQTGLAYLPFGLVIGAGIAVASHLVPRIGARPVLTAGFVFGAAGMLAMSRIGVHGSYLTQALPGLVLTAFGSGLCFSGFANASVHGVSQADASLASGVQQSVQQVGGAVGLAVLATLALRHAASGVRHGMAPLAASTAGDVAAFRVGAGVLALGAVASLVALERGAGTEAGV